MYTKLKSPSKSGAAPVRNTHRQLWILDNFTFLDAHIFTRTKTRVMGSRNKGDDVKEEEEESMEEQDDVIGGQQNQSSSSQLPLMPSMSRTIRPVSDSSSSNRKGKKRKESSRVDETIVQLCERLTTRPQLQQIQRNGEDDPRLGFVLYMRSEVRLMTEDQFDEFQQQVIDMMVRFRATRRQAAQSTSTQPDCQTSLFDISEPETCVNPHVKTEMTFTREDSKLSV